MKIKLTKVILNTRQFVGMLFVLFGLATLFVEVVVAYQPVPEAEYTRAFTQYTIDEKNLQLYGFVLPTVNELAPPLVGATVFLAFLYVWLGRKPEPTLPKTRPLIPIAAEPVTPIETNKKRLLTRLRECVIRGLRCHERSESHG